MDKLEMPEEFVSRVNLHDRGWHGMSYQDEVAAVAARDAEIRADERQKAAENWEAFARKIWGSNRVMKVEQFVSEGKAAIMAEPEEAHE